MASGHTCGTCRFFLRDTNVSADGGYCRRYPPTIKVVESTLAMVPVKPSITSPGQQQMPVQVLSANNLQSHFPMMNADGWCGEHFARLGGLDS